MEILRKIRRGAGYLPGYGEHPGTPLLIMMVLMGILAGAGRGSIRAALGGGAVMLVVFGPLWCMGCVGRANAYDRRQERDRAS